MKLLYIFLISILLVGCGNSSNEQADNEASSVVEDETSLDITPEYIESEILDLSALNDVGFGFPKSTLKELFEDINKLKISKEEEPYFVTYWLLNDYKKIDKNIEEIYKDTQIRKLYEETWFEVAQENYGVTVNEEKFDKLVAQEKDVLLEAGAPESLDTFLKLRGYTFEEFINHYEYNRMRKAALSLDLLPVLSKKYGVEDTHTLINEYFHPTVMDKVMKKLSN